MNSTQLLTPRERKIRLIKLEREKARRLSTNRLNYYDPYPKQRDFHDAGASHTERIFIAANQVGKTLAGGAEWAMHLTGRYPEDWKGQRFQKPVKFWCGGVTSQSTRDNPQRILVGPPSNEAEWGTGMIPKDCILDTSPARSVANALDTMQVRHVTGGISYLWFKTYEMGRKKWQGETLDGVWFDEEPPLDIYAEGLTRTQAGGHFSILTFTPLEGMSDVVMMFLTEADLENMK